MLVPPLELFQGVVVMVKATAFEKAVVMWLVSKFVLSGCMYLIVGTHITTKV